MPKYLIYWGPNPPDPLGRFAPKIGLSPNLVAFGHLFPDEEPGDRQIPIYLFVIL